MPNITIVKIKVRRGTDAQRRAIVLEQGELGFTTDTKRLYIGDGVTNGGVAVAPAIYPALSRIDSITNVPASVGEIVPAGSLIFQLTSADFTKLSSWGNISTQPDNVTLEYTGTDSKVLSLKPNSIKNDSFNSTAAYQFGGITATASNGLSANVDGVNVILNNNQITITSISADKISSSALGAGLKGGDGTKIELKVGSEFGFDPTTKYLKLTSLPAGLIGLQNIDTSNLYGDGLTLDNLDRIKLDKDNILGAGLALDGSNKIALDSNTLTLAGGGIEYLPNQGLYLNLAPVIGDNLSINIGTGKLQADVPTADNASILSVNNVFEVADVTTDQVLDSFSGVSYNTKGQIIDSYSLIQGTLTASTVGSYLSVFNGCPDQATNGYGYKDQTIVNATSAFDDGLGTITYSNIKLSSAGFMFFNDMVTDDEGRSSVNRFAIPIFAY